MSRISVREYAKEQWVLESPGLEAQLNEVGRELKASLVTRSVPMAVTGRRNIGNRAELKLQVREITGVIPVGEDVIEIQPKFLASSDDKSSWREGLLAVLAHIRGLDDLPRIAGGVVPESFVDLIGLVVASGLAQAVQEGVPRQYIQRREDSPVFKGRLDVGQAWRISLDPTRIPVVYDEFSSDTPAIRLLLWAASSLRHAVISKPLGNQLENLASIWHDIPAERPSPFEVDGISLPIQYSFLEDAVRAAKILASGEFLGMSKTEQENSFGFVWKTETVFEEFVLEVCKSAAGYVGASADKLRGPVLLDPYEGTQAATRLGGGTAVTGSPDVVIHRHGVPLAILDAKYKRLKRVSSASAGAPSAADVYQVSFYAGQAELDRVALVYPAQAGFRETRRWPVAWPKGSDSRQQPKSVYAFNLDLARMAREGGFDALVQEMRSNLSILMG